MVSASFMFFSFACAFDEAQKKVRPAAITPPRMRFVIRCVFTVLLLLRKKISMPMPPVCEHPDPFLEDGFELGLPTYRATDERTRACESCIMNMMPMRLEKLRQADLN